ncbi:hypothetical protein [Planktothricoides raciborskii]|uniref:Uncharacterized protein n=1 Tax=Planktothricoides raciborskii FACHB-1370 TaxID=2949576 RepID=A0ABR8EJ64_9CYAN|nr:hypothetical protein [Planktothricoides raciborskii]MBD2546164.1 hypothetical protein [Planktothricoides raciborskii FACHB-1370]MBD2583838.1 hypothetical protein [Planktothricoides raciborskii FACHB-1261]
MQYRSRVAEQYRSRVADLGYSSFQITELQKKYVCRVDSRIDPTEECGLLAEKSAVRKSARMLRPYQSANNQ